MTLGLTRGEVRLGAGDPRWPEAFRRLAVEMRRALGDRAVDAEHVGSTAVPGLRAKPILDIALGMSARATPEDLITRLAPLGYEFRGDKGDDGGLLFVLEDAPERRIAHVHAVPFGGPLWNRYIAFRDRLRGSAGARAEYEDVKVRLAARFPGDRQAYTAAKAAFISQLLSRPPRP